MVSKKDKEKKDMNEMVYKNCGRCGKRMKALYPKGVKEVCSTKCQFIYKRKRPTFSKYKYK